MLKWFLSEFECPICGMGNIYLHPTLRPEHGPFECGECEYEIDEADEVTEVPESFARSEFELAEIPWEDEAKR